MKKFFMLLLLVPMFALSQKKDKANSVETQNALLWEISGGQLKEPSYLYGTIHMICPADFRMSDLLKKKFESSKNLFLELDMDDPSMNMKTLQLSMMKQGSIKELMTSEEYTELEKFMKDTIGLPLGVFNKMKPFTLMSIMYTKILPCKGMESYEQRFLEMAKSQKKEVNGLEKLEDQFAVFDNIPDSVEIDMIMEMTRKFGEQKAEFAKMVDAYKAKDLIAMQKMISSSPDMAGFEDVLLVNRNKNWIPVMEKNMVRESTFFAVGAGHLPGDDGVIELLRKAGYTVKPVE